MSVPMVPDDPEFTIMDQGNGWWIYRCGPLSDANESAGGQIAGTIQGSSLEEVQTKLSELYSGATFEGSKK